MTDVLTTATAIRIQATNEYEARIIVANTHPGDVHKALYALNIVGPQPVWSSTIDTFVVVPLPQVQLHDVAQAAAEAIARAIGHVLPSVTT